MELAVLGAIALLAGSGVVAAIREVARDGHGRIPPIVRR